MARSSMYMVDETIGLVLEDRLNELDSGDEDDIQEDPEFPLPHASDEESDSTASGSCSEEEGLYTWQKTDKGRN